MRRIYWYEKNNKLEMFYFSHLSDHAPIHSNSWFDSLMNGPFGSLPSHESGWWSFLKELWWTRLYILCTNSTSVNMWVWIWYMKLITSARGLNWTIGLCTSARGKGTKLIYPKDVQLVNDIWKLIIIGKGINLNRTGPCTQCKSIRYIWNVSYIKR
jgi:hypothetical protein